MKRITILIIAMSIAANFHAKAQQRQQVTQEEVTRIAIRLLTNQNAHTERTATNFQMTEKRDSIGNVILYEVTVDSISVLLSGSRACYPLLGKYHAPNGPLLNNYDNLPDNLRWLIDGYIAQIVPCFSNDTIRLYYNDEWNNLIEDINLFNRDEEDVEEIILDFSSKWMQKGCNIDNNNLVIGYEYYMPPDINNSCIHSSVGCGAVAMGQVLNYWKHPVSSDWNITYDWCNMTDILDVNSPDFLKNREAIAHLLKDCAVPITTNYICDDGSLSDFTLIPSALINYFKYSPNAHIERKIDYRPDDWNVLLKNQIDQKRPIIYGGGGHTFVCYGYQDNHQGGFFILLNMGNGNIGNGWYTPNTISFYHPIHDVYYNFTSNQSAIVDIYPKPNDYIVLCDRDVELDDYYGHHQEEISNGSLLPWKILPVTVTNLTSASLASPASWRTIPFGEESTYRAQESVTLRDGFSVARGAEFAAVITPCDNCGSREFVARMLDSPMNNASEHAEQQMQGYSEGTSSDAEGSMSFLSLRGNEDSIGIRIHPNPTRGKAAVTLAAGAPQGTVLKVLDMAGHEVLSQPVASGAENVTLDLSALSAGTYFVTLATPQGSSTQKLILE